jgi:hypothetical protein
MWVVRQDEKGGTVAYRNYIGVTNQQWKDDIKRKIQCPEAFKMKEWERRSQQTQKMAFVPMTNTTEGEGMFNLFNNGGSILGSTGSSSYTTTSTQAIPYTSEEVWVEQRYECDWENVARKKYENLSTEDKEEYAKLKCADGAANFCAKLTQYYSIQSNNELKILYGKKTCDLKNPNISPKTCHILAFDIMEDHKVEAIELLKKGCELESIDASPEKYSQQSCAYHAGHTKNKIQIEKYTVDIKEKCKNDKNSCYDLACIYSLANEIKTSLSYLQKSLDLGFNDWEQIKNDKDLDTIKQTPKFTKILNKFQERKPASKKDTNKIN